MNPRATDEECLEVLRRAACDSLLARASKGLDTVIGEGGVKVSGGEKQRLSIARALLRHPQLVVFDEATSSLDSLTEEGIVDTIRDVARIGESITILIAHRLSTILHADRIYVLERGRIVETGRHDELVALKGLYFAMWRQQIGERRGAESLCRLFPPASRRIGHGSEFGTSGRRGESPISVTTEPTDTELLERMASGDRDALALIFRRHQATVYRFSRQMLGSSEAAEDVTQDVFVALAKGASRFNPAVASLSTYLYGIARNLVLQRHKRSRGRAEVNIDAVAGEEEAAFATSADPADSMARSKRHGSSAGQFSRCRCTTARWWCSVS